MSITYELLDAVRQIEDALARITDPSDKMAAADHVRADLAQLLTRVCRQAAWEARQAGPESWQALKESQWRGHDYLLQMAKQYGNDTGQPVEKVRDIVTRRLLDLNDLKVLRGQAR